MIALAFYTWSAIKPHGYFIWFLETVPSAIGLAAIFFSRNSFPLSNFLYRIILIHTIILSIGGHYTYAQVPLYNHLQEILGSARNDFDKVGHFFQGITPALLTRELIIKKTNLKSPTFTFIFCISTALAFSGLYEIFEWLMAVTTGEGAEFVSMQGDIWDAQKDMLTALFGAIFILVFFGKAHDKSISNQ